MGFKMAKTKNNSIAGTLKQDGNGNNLQAGSKYQPRDASDTPKVSPLTINTDDVVSLTAPASATNLLSSNISLAGVANTVVNAGLTSTEADLVLEPGDRLVGKLGGLLTGLLGSTVTVTLKEI